MTLSSIISHFLPLFGNSLLSSYMLLTPMPDPAKSPDLFTMESTNHISSLASISMRGNS